MDSRMIESLEYLRARFRHVLYASLKLAISAFTWR